MKNRNALEIQASRRSTYIKRQTHHGQKRGLFIPQQKELVRRISAKRARGLPVSGMWCRVTMRKLVKEIDGRPDTEPFRASCTWFNKFKKRWGFSFQQKTNVKKKTVAARLPYVRKYHQYLLYKAFNEEPG